VTAPTQTAVAEEYTLGRDEGLRYAEQDLTEDYGRGIASYWLEWFRDDIEHATTRENRARAIGTLRGYREGVRTQLGGRWGT